MKFCSKRLIIEIETEDDIYALAEANMLSDEEIEIALYRLEFLKYKGQLDDGRKDPTKQ